MGIPRRAPGNGQRMAGASHEHRRMDMAFRLFRSGGFLALLFLTQCTGSSGGGGSKGSSSGAISWSASDVGAVGSAGGSTISGGSFSVDASGADIWGSADAFRFVYSALSGDGS